MMCLHAWQEHEHKFTCDSKTHETKFEISHSSLKLIRVAKSCAAVFCLMTKDPRLCWLVFLKTGLHFLIVKWREVGLNYIILY